MLLAKVVVPKFEAHRDDKVSHKLGEGQHEKERCKVDSGTFGKGLFAFVRGLAALAENVEALARSDIYKQRLLRCVFNPRNKKALEDFLVLDNVYRGFDGLIGGENAATLWKVREKTFKEVRSTYLGSRPAISSDDRHELGARWKLWKCLLHLRFEERTPEGIWKELGWE